MDFYPKPEIVREVAEFFNKAEEGFRAQSENIATRFGVTQTHAIIVLRTLVKRKFLLKVGGHSNAASWQYNPNYPGTMADVMSGFKLKEEYKDTIYPDDFKVAGPAHIAPRQKEPYEKQYFQELMALKNIAEASRK